MSVRQIDLSAYRAMCPIYCVYHVKVNDVHLLKRLSSSGYVHVLVDKCALLSANDHHSARLIAAILPLTSIILRFSPRRTTYHHQSPEPQRTRSHAHKHHSKIINSSCGAWDKQRAAVKRGLQVLFIPRVSPDDGGLMVSSDKVCTLACHTK